MADLERTKAFIAALERHPESSSLQTHDGSHPEVLLPVPSLDLDIIGESVAHFINRFAEELANILPIAVDPEPRNTEYVYHHPDSRMVIFTLSPLDHQPTPLPTQAASRQDILSLYDSVELTSDQLAKVIIEQRPSDNGLTFEASVKSHLATPISITEAVIGSNRVIGHLNGLPDQEYTTIKLTPLANEDSESFADRIKDAIETTGPGIIKYHTESDRRARQALTLAA